jgi:pyrroline-5-carboxylate reductase
VLSVLGCGTMGVAILNGISRALISNSAINCQYIVYLVSPCRNPRHTRWRMSSGTVP